MLGFMKFMGFSKKRFFITLGLSVGVWLVSGFVQVLINKGEFGSYVFGTGCELTGYPISLCISNNDRQKFILIVLANIMFWFWVIHLFWHWFEKRDN